MELLLNGFVSVLQPQIFFVLVAGTLGGIIIGSLPGLTATMGVALLTPLTFSLPPATGLVMLCGIYCGAIYGGSISAILIRTPGTPAAAATVFDGNELAKKGLAGKALGMSAIASGAGGIFSALCLTFIAPELARVALSFSSPEYFAMGLLGLSIVASISGDYVVRGLISACIGLLVGLVGLDNLNGYPRFTFGLVDLLNGVSFIPVLIGLFAVSEAMRTTESMIKTAHVDFKLSGVLPSFSELRGCAKTILKSSAIGTMIGIIPATGGDIAAFLAYGEAKRSSKNGDKFGTGELEGVAAPEAANNSGAQTSFIPMLTLGIPTSAVMALMVGAMTIMGIQPGPTVMTSNPGLFWGLITSMWIGNVMLVILNLPMIGIWIKLLTVPYRFLFPAIMAFCAIGVYTLSNSSFDVYCAAVFAVAGLVFNKLGFEPAPLVLGFVLGPLMEENLRRTLLMGRGDWSVFITSPIAGTMIALSAVLIVVTALPSIKKKRQEVFVED